MPSVIFIEPEYTDGPHFAPNDDHPPTGISRGQAFVADVYSALTANRVRWARNANLAPLGHETERPKHAGRKPHATIGDPHRC